MNKNSKINPRSFQDIAGCKFKSFVKNNQINTSQDADKLYFEKNKSMTNAQLFKRKSNYELWKEHHNKRELCFKPLNDEMRIVIVILFLENYKISKISHLMNINNSSVIAYIKDLIIGKRKIGHNNIDINDP